MSTFNSNRYYNRVIFTILIAIFSANAMAASQSKVAVLDPEGSLLASKAFETFQTQIKKEFATEEAAIKSIGDDLSNLQTRIQKDEAIMSDEEKRKVIQEINEKRENGQFQAQQLQKKIQQRQQEWLREMGPKLNEAIKVVVEKDKYDVVVQRGAVLFVGPTSDISKKVTEALNKTIK